MNKTLMGWKKKTQIEIEGEIHFEKCFFPFFDLGFFLSFLSFDDGPSNLTLDMSPFTIYFRLFVVVDLVFLQ